MEEYPRSDGQLYTFGMIPESDNKTKDLKSLIVRLKCGEYDSKDIMMAWIALEEYIEQRETNECFNLPLTE
jgi:hypothetical protein